MDEPYCSKIISGFADVSKRLMRVFLYLMVVGVGAAITLNPVEGSASAQPSPQYQDNSVESHLLPVESNSSIPNIATERKAHEDHSSSVSPLSESVEVSPESSTPLLQEKFKLSPKRVTPSHSPQETSLSVARESMSRSRSWASSSQLGLETNFKTQPKHDDEGSSRVAEMIAPPTIIESDKYSFSLGEFQSQSKGIAENSTDKDHIIHLSAITYPQHNSSEHLPLPAMGESDNRTPEMPAQGETRSQLKQVPRLQEIAQVPMTNSAEPLNSFPASPPNGTLQTNPPGYLESRPNPLSFPTRSDEVKIEGTQPITLKQALDLARRNSETLQQPSLQLQQSQAALREAKAAWYPTLDLQIDANNAFSASSDLSVMAANRRARDAGQPATNQSFANSTINSNLQLSYDVDLFGRTASTVRAAEQQVRYRELELERLVEELRLNVTTAYYDVQNADGQVAISEAAVKNAQKSLQDAEALERAGVGTRFAVLQSQVNLSNEQQNLNNARRDQLIGQRRLTEILNVNGSVQLLAADPVEQAGSWKLSLDESIVLALKNRAELEEQLVQRDLSKEQRRTALTSQLPRLNLSATYGVLGLIPGDGNPYATRGWADGYSLSARLTWNLFDGGATQARVKQREFDIALAESRFSQLRNQIRREVEQYYFTLESSFNSIGTAEKGVEQAKESLRLARLRFQAGVGTQTDVINSETDLTRAQRNLLLAIIGYNRALSSLQRAVSNLPDSNLSDIPSR
jgi:outer membrane protein TolC